MFSPDDGCSTRPLNRRRPGPSPALGCTPSAHCGDGDESCPRRDAMPIPLRRSAPFCERSRETGWRRAGVLAKPGDHSGESKGGHRGARHDSIAIGNVPAVRIEAEDESAWCGAERLPLMPRAFAVLQHLVEHAGRLVTKEALLASVWRDAAVSDAALTTCIRDLRRALGDSPDAPRYIETVHRRGFRFIGPLAGPASSLARPRRPAEAARPAVLRRRRLRRWSGATPSSRGYTSCWGR